LISDHCQKVTVYAKGETTRNAENLFHLTAMLCKFNACIKLGFDIWYLIKSWCFHNWLHRTKRNCICQWL